MSAYVVDDKVINNFIDYISSGRDMEWFKRKIGEQFQVNLDRVEGKQKLGTKMFFMNVSAVNQRYKGGAEDFRPLDYSYKFTGSGVTIFHAIKSLSCWLYQCAEGDVYNSPEYNFFNQIKGDLSYHTVSRMKEYESSKGWG